MSTCAELAHAARPVGVARSLQQLVQPMGAGKSFGTLTGAGGGKFAPMAGGKPAAAAADGAEGGDGGSARSAGLISRFAHSLPLSPCENTSCGPRCNTPRMFSAWKRPVPKISQLLPE